MRAGRVRHSNVKNDKFQEVKKMKKEYEKINITIVSIKEDAIRTSGDNYVDDSWLPGA